tara:strand:- start:3540 stop:5324 length:1785 start_codon:yes stop_codon:yes gene_type:complete
MCGIYGYWKNTALSDDDIKTCISQTNKLTHRGPDNLGYWYDRELGIFLGHTRLSIIDLSEKSNQPFVKYNKIILYNGELYNYLDIKKTLKIKGYKFETDGDTEVIVAAWDYWGENCVKYFDGMYAFGIFDKQKLYLVTDYFGEKPLYYHKSEEALTFSSEPNQIIVSNNLNFNPSYEENLTYLAFGFIPMPSTGYQNLFQIKPASILQFDNYKTKKEYQYWNINRITRNKKNKIISKSDIKKLKELLLESIETRLISDVSVGLFLSSGIDSTLLAALIKRELNHDLDTFTVSLEGADESDTASKIAKHLNLKHTVLYSNFNNDFDNIHNSLFNVYGGINDNLSALSIKQMCELTKHNVKVAISGTGGDELFLGYNKYRFIHKYRHIYNLNVNLKTFFGYMIKQLGNSKLKNFYNIYFSGSKLDNFIAIKNFQIKKLFDKHSLFFKLEHFEIKNKDFLEMVHSFDIKHTLPNSYLSSVDRGSMQESIEVRSPYINKKLFEFTNNFALGAFLNKENKYIQTQILKDYIPKNLINQKKYGFNTPKQNYQRSVNIDENKTPIYLKKFYEDIKASNINDNKDINNFLLRINQLKYFYNR